MKTSLGFGVVSGVGVTIPDVWAVAEGVAEGGAEGTAEAVAVEVAMTVATAEGVGVLPGKSPTMKAGLVRYRPPVPMAATRRMNNGTITSRFRRRRGATGLGGGE